MSQTSLWALKIQLKTSVEIMFTTRPKKLDTTENKTRKFMNTIRMFGFNFFFNWNIQSNKKATIVVIFDLYKVRFNIKTRLE